MTTRLLRSLAILREYAKTAPVPQNWGLGGVFHAFCTLSKWLRVLRIDIGPLDLGEPIHVLMATTFARTRRPRCGRYSNRVHSLVDNKSWNAADPTHACKVVGLYGDYG